tara:strand:+ start:447 stop:797 length:351 start_codon:yes stop_codon:yes gene_type:complete
MHFIQVIILFISFSFIFYALHALFSKKMKDEFSRWGVQKYRILISCIQLSSGFFLLLSFFYPFLVIYCSTIFFIMMIGAIFVRIRTKDSFLDTLPALLYFFLNAIIIYIELQLIMC